MLRLRLLPLVFVDSDLLEGALETAVSGTAGIRANPVIGLEADAGAELEIAD